MAAAPDISVSQQEYLQLLANLRRMKVSQLKDLNRVLGLSMTGRKAEILDRIHSRVEQLWNLANHVELACVRVYVYKVYHNEALPYYPALLAAMQSGSETYIPSRFSNDDILYPRQSPQATGLSHEEPPAKRAHVPKRTFSSLETTPYKAHCMYFKSSPYFKVKRLLHAAPVLAPISTGRGVCQMKFVLNEVELTELENGSQCYLVAGIPNLRNPSTTDALILFPSPIEMHINDTLYSGKFNGIKGKPGTARPINITSLLKLSAKALNSVLMVYLGTKDPYLLYCYLVEKVLSERILGEILERSHISSEATTRQIQQEFSGNDDDDDIVVAENFISLKCPLTYTRMHYPCRSIYCTHIQCFDALNYIQLQEQIPTSTCPICSSVIMFQDLAISDYFSSILRQVLEDTENISLSEDGTWEAVELKQDSTPKPRKNINQNEVAIGKEPSRNHASPPVTANKEPEIEVISLDSDSEDEVEVRNGGDNINLNGNIDNVEDFQSSRTHLISNGPTNTNGSIEALNDADSIDLEAELEEHFLAEEATAQGAAVVDAQTSSVVQEHAPQKLPSQGSDHELEMEKKGGNNAIHDTNVALLDTTVGNELDAMNVTFEIPTIEETAMNKSTTYRERNMDVGHGVYGGDHNIETDKSRAIHENLITKIANDTAQTPQAIWNPSSQNPILNSVINSVKAVRQENISNDDSEDDVPLSERSEHRRSNLSPLPPPPGTPPVTARVSIEKFPKLPLYKIGASKTTTNGLNSSTIIPFNVEVEDAYMEKTPPVSDRASKDEVLEKNVEQEQMVEAKEMNLSNPSNHTTRHSQAEPTVHNEVQESSTTGHTQTTVKTSNSIDYVPSSELEPRSTVVDTNGLLHSDFRRVEINLNTNRNSAITEHNRQPRENQNFDLNNPQMIVEPVQPAQTVQPSERLNSNSVITSNEVLGSDINNNTANKPENTEIECDTTMNDNSPGPAQVEETILESSAVHDVRRSALKRQQEQQLHQRDEFQRQHELQRELELQRIEHLRQWQQQQQHQLELDYQYSAAQRREKELERQSFAGYHQQKDPDRQRYIEERQGANFRPQNELQFLNINQMHQNGMQLTPDQARERERLYRVKVLEQEMQQELQLLNYQYLKLQERKKKLEEIALARERLRLEVLREKPAMANSQKSNLSNSAQNLGQIGLLLGQQPAQQYSQAEFLPHTAEHRSASGDPNVDQPLQPFQPMPGTETVPLHHSRLSPPRQLDVLNGASHPSTSNRQFTVDVESGNNKLQEIKQVSSPILLNGTSSIKQRQVQPTYSRSAFQRAEHIRGITQVRAASSGDLQFNSAAVQVPHRSYSLNSEPIAMAQPNHQNVQNSLDNQAGDNASLTEQLDLNLGLLGIALDTKGIDEAHRKSLETNQQFKQLEATQTLYMNSQTEEQDQQSLIPDFSYAGLSETDPVRNLSNFTQNMSNTVPQSGQYLAQASVQPDHRIKNITHGGAGIQPAQKIIKHSSHTPATNLAKTAIDNTNNAVTDHTTVHSARAAHFHSVNSHGVSVSPISGKIGDMSISKRKASPPERLWNKKLNSNVD